MKQSYLGFELVTIILTYVTYVSEFYDKLERECSKIPRYDVIVLLGDFNAKLGKEEYLRHVIGKYSLHNETNENGKLLCQLAEANQLIIKSTCFQHKNTHKETWKIPGTGEVNQIDHVLISKRHSSSITDVKSAQGPNCDSDHYLVKVLFCKKLANVSNLKGSKRTRWNIEKLQQP
jgi:endonuclease/exonuclease/phosphatase family metal-dependent hydrolase